MHEPPATHLHRGPAAAVAVVVLLLAAWAGVLLLTRGTPAAETAAHAALLALFLGASACALRASARLCALDRHLWWVVGAGVLGSCALLASTGWRGWLASSGERGAASALDTALLLGVVVATLLCTAPLLWSANTAAGGVRDAVDCALLTAVAATAAWYGVFAGQPATGAVGPLTAPTALAVLAELFAAVVAAQTAVRTRTIHPGMGLLAAGGACLVVGDLVAAALSGDGRGQPGDLVQWCWAVAAALVLAGAVTAGRSAGGHAGSDAGSDAGRPVAPPVLLSGSAAPWCTALLALATALPAVADGGPAGPVGSWLHLAVLVLLVGRAALLVLDAERLTRGLEQRVDERTRALAREEHRFAALVVHSTDAVGVVDADGTVTYASPAVDNVFGVSSAELLGRSARSLLGEGPAAAAVGEALREVLEGTAGRCRLRTTLPHAGGRLLTVDVTLTDLRDDPAVRGVVVNVHDVTEAARLEEELGRQAFSDALTGLPNRALFSDRLEHALRGRGTRGPVEVLYLDLDGFKAVNDTLGHDAGDELLVAVAERLRTVVREGDTVARLGGDEFAVLLDETTDAQETERLAQRVCDAVRRPFAVREVQVHVSTSVGIASTETAGRDVQQLLRGADLAMYQAKSQRPGGHASYHPRMHDQLAERVQLEADLHRAVREGEFRVVYQPLVDMGTGGVCGVEALVRWHHPDRGVVAPTAFIPLAEATGTIVAIGAFVLRESARQVATWRAEVPGAEDMRLSVNLSGVQLADPGLADQVVAALAEAGLPPTALVLEVTESMIVDQDQTALSVLNALRAHGIRLAIDDFGTGYSSLSYLHRLPVDIIKIDKSFVDRLDADGDLSLVDAILHMAGSLDLATVAEGIEHEHQRAVLAAQGCSTGQGYHFSPPVEAHLLPELVTAALRTGRTGGEAPSRSTGASPAEVAR